MTSLNTQHNISYDIFERNWHCCQYCVYFVCVVCVCCMYAAEIEIVHVNLMYCVCDPYKNRRLIAAYKEWRVKKIAFAAAAVVAGVEMNM